MAQWESIHLPLQEMQEMGVWSLDQEDPLDEGMATHFSILAWRIPSTEEPGGHDSRELAHTWKVCISTYKVPFHFILTRTLEEYLFTPSGFWDQMLLSETLSFSFQPHRNCPGLLVWVWILSGFWTDFSVRPSQGLYDRHCVWAGDRCPAECREHAGSWGDLLR